MTIYLYARVSTSRQETDNQISELAKRYPEAIPVMETAGGTKERPKLDALITNLEPGDRVVVWALDRLGRSLIDVVAKIERLVAKGAVLVSVRENVDYGSIGGKLVTQVMAAVAEAERSMICERIRLALSRAKARGVKLGRTAKYPSSIIKEAQDLHNQGLSVRKVADKLNVPKSCVGNWVVVK